MRRLILLFILCAVPGMAAAQTRDSHFEDYAAYDRFVDAHLLSRDFVPLIQTLGGRDEYTVEQLSGINSRFLSIYPQDFRQGAVIRETDLGHGFRQEARVYWTDGTGYLYYFAMLHDRPDALIVLTFTINSDVSEIMKEF